MKSLFPREAHLASVCITLDKSPLATCKVIPGMSSAVSHIILSIIRTAHVRLM